MDAEFRADVAAVGSDSMDRYAKLVGNLLVSLSLRDGAYYIPFTPAESIEQATGFIIRFL